MEAAGEGGSSGDKRESERPTVEVVAGRCAMWVALKPIEDVILKELLTLIICEKEFSLPHMWFCTLVYRP